jgi:DNA helicase IV
MSISVNDHLDKIVDHLSNSGVPNSKLATTPISWFKNPSRCQDNELQDLLFELYELRPNENLHSLVKERPQIRAAEFRERQKKEAELKNNARNEAKQIIFRQLQEDYLISNDELLCSLQQCVSGKDLDVVRIDYIKGWFKRNKKLLGGMSTPDPQQLHAIGSVYKHTLVTARAGSGKTSTIVARVLFLVKHCDVSPAQILLLAFNKKAAGEIKAKLSRLGIKCPHVMTFHALAYAIALPQGGIVCDESDDGEKHRSKLMDNVIMDFLKDSRSKRRVESVMRRHFRKDWDNVIISGMALSQAEGLLLRRSLDKEAIDGTPVKSFGEKVIANFLVEHGIRYKYEETYIIGERIYRPDFTVTGRKIIIEYFGMAGDTKYDEEIQKKRDYWRRREWKLLEYYPNQIRDDYGQGLQKIIANDLSNLGIPICRLSEEEIWQSVKNRHLTKIGVILTNMVGRCIKALLTPGQLDIRLRKHTSLDDIEQDVLGILSDVYRGYIDRMEAEGKVDFDLLIQQAADMVSRGKTTFERESQAGDLKNMRFVMVDEYQDFSHLFDRLLKAVLAQAEDTAQVFGVGDDWQAINAFAGADLRYFREFTQIYQSSTQLSITTNYRSAFPIVELGNELMRDFGELAEVESKSKLGTVCLADLENFYPNIAERYAWKGDYITPAVRRLIKSPLSEGKSIAILARQRYLPYQVAYQDRANCIKEDNKRLAYLLTQDLGDTRRDQIDVDNAHQYKGREADVVIILDAVQRRFPKLHPDWVFGRVFGDNYQKLIEDERRLFYVACSRAKESLFIITEGHRQSPFISNIKGGLVHLDWKSYPSFCPDEGDWILAIGNAKGYGTNPTKKRAENKVFLESNYKYYGGNWPHWSKRIPIKHSLNLIIKDLHKAPWFNGPDGLEIRVYRSDGFIAACGVLQGRKYQRIE